jgi:hypothetical protein
MHEMTALTIWLALTIAGMMLTLLMPRIFPDAPHGAEARDNSAHRSSYEDLEGDRMSIVYGDKAA